MTRAVGRLTLSCWIVGLVAAIAAVWTLGRGVGRPPLGPDAIGWVADRHPLDAAAGIARVVAVALLAHLVVATVLQLLAPRRTRRHLRGVAPRFVAVLVAAATSATPVAADDTTTATTTTVGPGMGASMVQVGPAPAADTSLPWAVPIADEPPDDPAAPAGDRAEWTVSPGDHLWGIAERHVRAESPDAGDAEVAGYWSRLIEANRDRLVDRSDPDLILPGQRLTLP